MQRLLAVRIVRWPLKLAYIVVAAIVGIALGRLIAAARIDPVTTATFSGLIGLAVYLYGARVFRGRGEEVARVRPWWQMTARAKLSRRLGVLMVVGFALQFVETGLSLAGHRGTTGFPALAVQTVFSAALAFLYVNSGVRLGRLEPATDLPEAAQALLQPQLDPTTPFVEATGPTTRVPVKPVGTFLVRSGSALLRAMPGATAVDVFVNRHRVGTLDGSALTEPLARSGLLLRVDLLRTGDRVWAELPTADAFAAASAGSAS